MTDMRRTLLWVVFTMSLIMLWDGWNKHNGQPTLFGAPVAATPAAASAIPSGASAAAVSPAVAAASASAVAPAVVAEQVTITTDVMKVVLDGKGGEVRHTELLNYPDAVDPTRNTVLMDQSAKRTYLAQSGLLAANGGMALPSHFTVMAAQPGERTLKDGANELVLRFESPEISGVKLLKTYTFQRGSYAVKVKHEVVNAGAASIQPLLYMQLQRDGNAPEGESSFYFTFTGPAVYSEEKKFEKVEFKEIEKRGPGDSPKHATKSNEGWIAMIQHYFTAAWLVSGGTPREFRTTRNAAVANLYEVALLQDLGAIAPGSTKAHEATLYMGPQEENKLAALAPGLELVKDYGVLTVLAKPMFFVLTWLHGVLGNWGWSIVALVVLLKIAFYWLNANAYKSMAKMKAINPRIMEMRERLKDKPQEMQQEMMRIYREEKVNPVGGCLPIFIQMPFFMALYWVLMATVEMRGAPWILWITDLSAKDPFFILPLLMTASSLLQVWLQPAPADPMQAKMMWVMPLMFSFMFFFFPSGLVLYWLVNNVLSIAQQWVINRRLGVN